MQVVHVHIHVKPEFVAPFKAATIANARESIKEPGIARFDFSQRPDDPTRFVLVETYRTAEAPAALASAARRSTISRSRRCRANVTIQRTASVRECLHMCWKPMIWGGIGMTAFSAAGWVMTPFAVRFLMRYFETRTLTPFAVYCFVAGLACTIGFAV